MNDMFRPSSGHYQVLQLIVRPDDDRMTVETCRHSSPTFIN